MNGGRSNHEWGFGATDRVAGVGAQQQRPLSIPTFDLAAFLDGVAARRLPRLASGARPPRVIVKMDVEGLDSTGKVPPWQCPSSASAPPQGAPGGSGQLALPGRGRPTGPSHCFGCSCEPPPKPADFTACDHAGSSTACCQRCCGRARCAAAGSILSASSRTGSSRPRSAAPAARSSFRARKTPRPSSGTCGQWWRTARAVLS